MRTLCNTSVGYFCFVPGGMNADSPDTEPDSSLDDDYLNIFIEYVPGGSVTALLRNYGAFEETLVKNFVRQILQGLNYLHERDIIHRDIKGANILVDNKGGIKISDFGISKKVGDSKCLAIIKAF